MTGDKPFLTVRLRLAVGAVLLLAALLVWRWQDLQVEQYARFAKLAHENQIKVLPVEPLRGLIFDRHGTQLAGNRTDYSLRVVSDFAGQVLGKIDTLREVLDISDKNLERLHKVADSSVYHGEIILRERLSDAEIVDFLGWQFLFPEIVLKATHVRYYPYGDEAGHALGFVGRINSRDKERLKEIGKHDDYQGANFIGKTGIELMNENYLRGKIGFQEAYIDAHGRILKSNIITPPISGKNIYLTLDWKLQRLAEDLLVGKRGAAVVMDATDGALLALASSPRFDINKFVLGISQKDWDALNTSKERPLIHRAIYGQYAPGSTIKPFLALSSLERGWRDLSYTYFSRGFFRLTPKHIFHDWKAGGHGEVDIEKSIVRSVNSFYYQLGHDIGIDKMHDALKIFGFGEKSGIDLDNEKSGVLPSSQWKKEVIGEKWYPGDTIAASVGQGYMQVTPLQMARAVAMIANGGDLLHPYLFKPENKRRQALVSEENLRVIRQAMAKVTQPGGTAVSVGRKAEYGIAGKTGTAQVSRLRLDSKGRRIKNEDLPEHLRDHAWFVGYAPVDKPALAVAVIVENGGSGGKAAGPIARQLLDNLLAKGAE